MTELIREAPLGQALRWLSGNKLFQYPEEQSDFVLPVEYIKELSSQDKLPGNLSTATTQPDISTGEEDIEALAVMRTKSWAETTPYSNERFEVEQQLALARTKTIPITPKKTTDGIILVDWYTTDDPANPQNASKSVSRACPPWRKC